MSTQKIRVIDAKTPLWKITYPIFIEILLHMLVGNIDQLMLSRYSDNAVAALGNVNQLIGIVFILFSVLATAMTIVVSQVLGAKDYDKVSEIYSVAVFVNLAFGVVMSVVMTLCAGPILRLIRTPDELMGDAMTYLLLVGGGLFGQAVISAMSAIFRANGHALYGTVVSFGVNLINIAGNALLLFGLFGLPRMGVAGVAISTLVSRGIGMVALLVLFHHKVAGKISLKYLRPFPKATLVKLLKVGVPSAGEELMYNSAETVLLGFANTMGAVVLAGRAYGYIISWFSVLYTVAVAEGTQIIVGHLIGAGDENAADKRVMRTLWPAVLVSLCITSTIYLNADFLLSLFTNNPEIIRVGKQLLMMEIIREFGSTFNVVIIRSLQAAGDVRFPVAIGIASMWGIMVPVSYLFGVHFGMGLVGLWIGVALDECVRAVIVFIRWKKGRWRGKAIAGVNAACT